MTRDEVHALAVAADRASALKKCIDDTDSLIRSWTRRKGEQREGICTISIHPRDRDGRWDRRHTHADVPAEFVFAHMVPVLRLIRDEAAAKLAAMALPGEKGDAL